MKAGHRILVVDESDRARKLLGDALSPWAAHLYLAKAGEEALDRARQEPFDIVFADLHVSGRDGISLLWELRQLRSELSAVVMSASASAESAIEAIRSGVADYLIKPLTRHKVLAALERAAKAPRGDRGQPHRMASAAQPVAGAIPDAPVAASRSMRDVLALAAKCAALDLPVVLQGEFGVGKDLLARTIHRLSARASRPFVKIDCGTASDRFMHSALFEREGGSQATEAHRPPLEAAPGALFLYDVDALPLSAKRVAIEQIERRQAMVEHGRTEARFHLIAATTKSSPVACESLPICRHLLHRAGGILIEIPPLRERTDDILPLAERFLREFAAPSCTLRGISDDAAERLQRHAWPGNASELRSAIRHAVRFAEGALITPEALPGSVKSAEPRGAETVQVPLLGNFRETQRQLVQNVVSRFDGNKTAAAKALGLNRRKLYRLLDEPACHGDLAIPWSARQNLTHVL